jgi:hypothetical protein
MASDTGTTLGRLLDRAATLALLAIGATLLWAARGPAASRAPVPVASGAAAGRAARRGAAVVEVTDLQCPFCGALMPATVDGVAVRLHEPVPVDGGRRPAAGRSRDER